VPLDKNLPRTLEHIAAFFLLFCACCSRGAAAPVSVISEGLNSWLVEAFLDGFRLAVRKLDRAVQAVIALKLDNADIVHRSVLERTPGLREALGERDYAAVQRILGATDEKFRSLVGEAGEWTNAVRDILQTLSEREPSP
jgi:hypothetical protein